jgi:hypothetical protein
MKVGLLRANALQQGGKHPLYFQKFCLDIPMLCGIKHTQIACEQKEVFEFAGRSHRHVQELPQLAPSSTPAALGNIRWNRAGRAPNLAAYPKPFLRWKLARQMVNAQHEFMTAAPHLKFVKILHGLIGDFAVYLKLNTYNLLLTRGDANAR